ncbi:RNA polymerase sigma factor SigJ [Rugosimonospora africana]|uniref:RNA polymerase sigma factor n=1 Tax=Rugosimonospora africana TaxID=556532 RepID=A0A8J3QYB1_9ACTN|nr:RNA polymerase sigma factor SigJ [Rugosimonospora africana]GIH18332.1 RNA polymerase sigma factor [Rugosimonospora africana]
MQWFAEQFEANRPHLRAVAYRMLGSLTEADDALQEAWIRTNRSDSRTISNIGGWLTTLVGRVCVDMLRARQSRRESLIGTWLPEPVVSTDGKLDPEQSSLLADSVGLALLVVLESLEPAERLAFVLHDMFAVPFDEIAPIVDRTPEATRQLASRARRRVRGTTTNSNADLPTQRRVVAAFLAASRAGEFEDLINLLDPDVAFRVDTGSRTWLAPALLTGATEVARHASAHGPRFATLCQPALVNGAAGIIARTRSGVVAVVGFTVIDERISEIDLLLDADKLAGLTISE